MKSNRKNHCIEDETWKLFKSHKPHKPEKSILSKINDLMYEPLPEEVKIKKWDDIFQLIELKKQSYLTIDKFWTREDGYCWSNKKFNPCDKKTVDKIKNKLKKSTEYLKLTQYQEMVLQRIEEENIKLRKYPLELP